MSARLIAISGAVKLEASRILEIGALDNPTFRRPEFNVAYVDYATRQELAKKGNVNPRYQYDKLVDVDYVVNGRRYHDVISETFDLIVANHVIEHIADPIAWLYDLGMLLNPDGCIFLSVPDRRYTFDILRREASLIDLLRAHAYKQTKPDFFNILDHLWYSRPAVKARDVWRNDYHHLLGQRRFTPEQVLTAAKQHANEAYADVHCYAYSEPTFKQLLHELSEFSLLGFQDIEMFPVAEMTNEFYVLLRRFSPERAHRVGCL